MDVSGVDVDFLNGDELLELCGNILDNKNDEIFVLKGVDIDNLSEDKVNEIYDNIIQSTEDNKKILSDDEVLNINSNILDTENQELSVINGYNINVDNLSDEELLALYNDIITDESILLAAATGGTMYCYTSHYGTYLCVFKNFTCSEYKYNSYYKSDDFIQCYVHYAASDASQNTACYIYNEDSKSSHPPNGRYLQYTYPYSSVKTFESRCAK